MKGQVARPCLQGGPKSGNALTLWITLTAIPGEFPFPRMHMKSWLILADGHEQSRCSNASSETWEFKGTT